MSEAVEADADGAEPDVKEGSTESLTTIVRAEVIQQVVDQLSAVCSEAIFRIGHDGLDVAVIDPANVAMVVIDLDAEAFESVGDGMFAIGVDITRLDDYLGGVSGDDPVQFGYLPEERRLNIRHTNVDVDMAAIDPDHIRQEPDLPDLNLPADIEALGDEFRDAVKNADLVSDQVVFEADVGEKEVRVIGEGDTDTIETSFTEDELLEASVTEDAKSRFSLSYLVGSGGNYHGMLNEVPKTELRVRFGTEHPLKLGYEFADGSGEARMMLAPRIDSS